MAHPGTWVGFVGKLMPSTAFWGDLALAEDVTRPKLALSGCQLPAELSDMPGEAGLLTSATRA